MRRDAPATLAKGSATLDQGRGQAQAAVGDTCSMRASIQMAEMGLALIFLSRSVTRLYQGRAIAAHGIAGARAAATPGSGVIPSWVSVLALTGWTTALVAELWIILG